MDSISLNASQELTREEENSLLNDDEDVMVVDSPAKTASAPSSQRKQIVFDLDDAEEDNDCDNNTRDKFRSERKTINFSLNEPKRRDIPDTLDLFRSKTNFKTESFRESLSRSQRRKRNKTVKHFGHQTGVQKRWKNFGRKQDLRQFIGGNQPLIQGLGSLSRSLGQGLGMTPLQNYQMKIGILDPIAAQNQLLIQLLAQTQHNTLNPLLNRLQISGQNLIPESAPKRQKTDNIQITIRNAEPKPINTQTKAPTKSKIRCHVKAEESTSDCEIMGMPSMPMQTKEKPQLKTLFAKHLESKAKEKSGNSSGGLFGDALAEVEVGVDNEYLRRMEEMERKRREILRIKEENRLAMADERMETAMKLKQKLKN